MAGQTWSGSRPIRNRVEVNAIKNIGGVLRPVLFAGALFAMVVGATGCAMTEPLMTEHLQEEAKDPRVSIILLRFKAPRLLPDKDFLGLVDRNSIPWVFAAANESTGWNFRKLDNFMVFHTRDDSMEPDISNTASGWLTFLAPPGLSYITVMNFSATEGKAQNWVVTPYNDHISVRSSASPATAGWWGLDFINKWGGELDFIDAPRFAVQVSQSRSLIYAGTIMRNNKCSIEEKLSACPYDLTVVDETELAKQFVSRYPKGFAGAPPMQTQLLAIPQTRTIEIHSGAATTVPSSQ